MKAICIQERDIDHGNICISLKLFSLYIFSVVDMTIELNSYAIPNYFPTFVVSKYMIF